MFSVEEKKQIAGAVEKVIMGLDHPEMPKERPWFSLHVQGKDPYSQADIKANWIWEAEGCPENPNQWNEKAREILKDK